MDSADLFKVLQSIHPISDDFITTLRGMLIPMTFPKNHMLLKPPAVCEHMYFINRGFVMCYSFCKKKKVVEGFWKEKQIVFSSQSFFGQKPSEQYIQLMRKSDLLAVSHAGIQELFVIFPETQQLFQLIINIGHQRAQKHVHDLKHLEANERFDKLLRVFPDIDRMVPQEAIASYIGITPQSFSRVKRSRENEY